MSVDEQIKNDLSSECVRRNILVGRFLKTKVKNKKMGFLFFVFLLNFCSMGR